MTIDRARDVDGVDVDGVPPAVRLHRRPGGPLARVRAATRAAHEDLDSSLAVLDRPWGPDLHREWLERTHGLFAPLERGLAAWAARTPGFLDVVSRARADLALADLEVLTRLAGDPGPVRVPAECPGVPVVTDGATALGIVYVLDGSTLGGKLIRDAVVAAGVPEQACTSLTGREGAGRRWRETMAALDAVPEHEIDGVVAAANATFAAYRRWLAPLRAAPGTGGGERP